MAKRGRSCSPLTDSILITVPLRRAKHTTSLPTTHVAKPSNRGVSQSTLLFQGFRSTIDGERKNRVERFGDEAMTGGKLGTNIDEQTTPSLMENGEESDSEGDEANTLDYLDEYIGSLTNDETDEILQGFETYIQHHHNDDSTVAEAAKNPSDNVGSSTKTPDVASFSSIRKWLQCRSTSDSVEGVRFNNVFEPSVHTLDGIRKQLFG